MRKQLPSLAIDLSECQKYKNTGSLQSSPVSPEHELNQERPIQLIPNGLNMIKLKKTRSGSKIPNELNTKLGSPISSLNAINSNAMNAQYHLSEALKSTTPIRPTLENLLLSPMSGVSNESALTSTPASTASFASSVSSSSSSSRSNSRFGFRHELVGSTPTTHTLKTNSNFQFREQVHPADIGYVNLDDDLSNRSPIVCDYCLSLGKFSSHIKSPDCDSLMSPNVNYS
jgi:hypothetical protein